MLWQRIKYASVFPKQNQPCSNYPSADGYVCYCEWLYSQEPMDGVVRYHWRHRRILLGVFLLDRDVNGKSRCCRIHCFLSCGGHIHFHQPDAPGPLDPLLHAELRLAVMSLLISVDEAEFPYIKEQTGATAGNLSVQIDKLSTAGYIEVEKTFKGKKPCTLCRITPKGRKAFEEYVEALKSYFK